MERPHHALVGRLAWAEKFDISCNGVPSSIASLAGKLLELYLGSGLENLLTASWVDGILCVTRHASRVHGVRVISTRIAKAEQRAWGKTRVDRKASATEGAAQRTLVRVIA